MAAVLCYPYGVTITCVCDNSGSVYNCYPTNYKNKQNNHFNSNSVQVRVDLQDAPKKTSVKEKLDIIGVPGTSIFFFYFMLF